MPEGEIRVGGTFLQWSWAQGMGRHKAGHKGSWAQGKARDNWKRIGRNEWKHEVLCHYFKINQFKRNTIPNKYYIENDNLHVSEHLNHICNYCGLWSILKQCWIAMDSTVVACCGTLNSVELQWILSRSTLLNLLIHKLQRRFLGSFWPLILWN